MASNSNRNLPSPPLVSNQWWKCRPWLPLPRCFSHQRSPLQARPPVAKPSLQDRAISSSHDGDARQRSPTRDTPAPAVAKPPMTHLRDGRSAAEAYWNRVCQLEQELLQLERWLDAEKNLIDHLSGTATAREAEGPVGEGTLRLEDGSCLRRVKIKQRSKGFPRRLVMQVSSPAIAESCSTASEVLRRMAAMGPSDLLACLRDTIPMHDVAGQETVGCRGELVRPGEEAGFMEAIILEALEKMGRLALEGLRIQQGSRGGAVGVSERTEETGGGEGVVLVALIQMRDAGGSYAAVGELMVGLVEASAAKVAGRSLLRVGDVHVCGLGRCGDGGGRGWTLWSVSSGESCC